MIRMPTSRLRLAALAAALGIAAHSPPAVSAESLAELGGTAELEARIAALEERLAEESADRRIRADAVSFSASAEPSAAGACQPPVGQDFLRTRSRSSGLYGGAEIMWLKPFATGISAALNDAASADEFLPAWRLWGGAQNCDGLGWRVSWWQWDQFMSGTGTSIFGDIPTLSQLNLTFQKLDLQATQMVSFRNWDLLFAGGVTYVGSNNDIAVASLDDPADFLAFRSRFDGWGLTTGLFAIRDLPRIPGLSFFSAVQWSGVYGNSVLSTATSDGGERLPISGTMANILEWKIGPQYERCIGRGTTLFVNGGFEAQYWSGLGSNFLEEGLGAGDVGLVGFTFGTGIRR